MLMNTVDFCQKAVLLIRLICFLIDCCCFYSVKWLHLLQSSINNSLHYSSFVCWQRNGFKYCYLTKIIQLSTIHFFLHVKWFQVFLRITNIIKMVLDTSWLSTQNSVLSIEKYLWIVNWSNPEKGVAPPTPRCSSYWKRSLRSSLNTVPNFIYIYIYIYICVCVCVRVCVCVSEILELTMSPMKYWLPPLRMHRVLSMKGIILLKLFMYLQYM